MIVVMGTNYTMHVLPNHILSKFILWQHTFYSLIQDPLWLCRQDMLEGILFETTWVPSVMSIELLLPLTSS